MKRILFLIDTLKIGGAEKVFVHDASALSKEGYDVYFALLLGAPEDPFVSELSLPKEKIFFARARNFYDLSALLRLRVFCRANRINIVYSTLNESNIAARLLKVLVPSLSICIREANMADYKPRKLRVLDFFLNALVVRIICVSEEVKASLAAKEPWRKGKMLVVMNGTSVPGEHKIFPPETQLPLRLVNVGSLTKKKGQKFLVEAMRIVESKRPSAAMLEIIGEGNERPFLSKIIRDHSLGNTVFLKGNLAATEVLARYLASDVFVLSSLWEGCPNVLLEASAIGLPSIATRVGGTSVIVEDGRSGKLVPKGDAQALAEAIIYMIDHRDMLDSFGVQARKRIENLFTDEKHLESLKRAIFTI
jgi:glycosyltransferase involved in cell wall biosynthesis